MSQKIPDKLLGTWAL